jgi:hypothetical protein
MKPPILKTFAACALAVATMPLAAQVVITGIADKAVYTDRAAFSVTAQAGYSCGARLDGNPVPLGVSVPVTNADYHELSVSATNNSTTTVTRQYVRFIVTSSERGNTENGLPPWVPYPVVNSAPEEFAGSQLRLIVPESFPAGHPVPVVAWVEDSAGHALRANGLLQAPGQSAIQLRRGVGSGFLPAPPAPGPLDYAAEVGGLTANKVIDIETHTSWTPVSGIVNGAVTWPAGSRIAVHQNLTIPAGSSLTIGEGTVVRLAYRVNLTNSGSLVIQGTTARPVVFMAEDPGQPWGGIIMHWAGAQLEARGTIFTGSGAESCFFDSQFCARPGAPHSHRGEQALLSCIGSGISVSMSDSAAISLAGQFGHSVEGGSYTFRFTRFLMQRCTTGGEYTGAAFSVNDSAFIECPADTGQFADADNDCLYLVDGTHGFTNTLLGYCKDDAMDSGASGAGVFNYEDCWFESAFHEANSLSGTGKRVVHRRSVFLNSGQALEAGYESPEGILEECLAIGNVVGGRLGDNYDWTYNGFLRATNSILIHNYRDVWGMNWADWSYRTGQMAVASNYLTAPDPFWPSNSVWNPEAHAPLLAGYFNGPADSPVGIAFALWSERLAPGTTAIPVRLSRFSTNVVSVQYRAESAAGVHGSGVLAFQPGAMVKSISLAGLCPAEAEVVSIRLLEPENGRLTGLSQVFVVNSQADPNSPLSLIAKGATWRFLDMATNLGTAWIDPAFPDADWKSGPAQLGFGDGDEVTTMASNGQVTTYFRHAFVVEEPAQFSTLTLGLLRDDGGMVYLNGTEVFRSNLPLGPVDYLTLATNALAEDETSYFHTHSVTAGWLRPGTNVVAVEIHQSSVTSSDLSFDFWLEGLGPSAPLLLRRARIGNQLVLFWSGEGFILEAAAALSGPWSAVGGNNPQAVDLGGPQRYFRLKR